MKFDLEFLEMMVTNVCNLSCQGCTTFSDLNHSGYVTWQQAHQQLEPWTHRLNIQAFGFMGGEPLINPEIDSWIQGVRQLLPQAQIRFVTNGTLLLRHWWVVDLLRDMGNSVLKISRHLEHDAVDQAIDKVFAAESWQPVQQFGINRWRDSTGMIFQVSEPETFLRTFQNSYADMAPHDSDPREAFDLCVQKRCPLLHDNQLFKCGTAGLTPSILDRFNRPNWQAWAPYVGTGLGIDCADIELEKFCANFGHPHAMCRQCPSTRHHHSVIPHRANVVFKKNLAHA